MILALDTATRVVSLALHTGLEVIAEETWRTANHHTVELSPAIELMMRRVGVTPTDLRAIAVALGPGSYTGLRIGMSLAKGMALAAEPQTPLIGVPTLDILAAAQPHQAERLCVVAQAGRGRVNAGVYAWKGDRWAAAEPPFIASLSDLAARLDSPIQVSGEMGTEGYQVLAELGSDVIVSRGALALRRAGYLAEIACQRLAAGQLDDPASLAPVYLH